MVCFIAVVGECPKLCSHGTQEGRSTRIVLGRDQRAETQCALTSAPHALQPPRVRCLVDGLHNGRIKRLTFLKRLWRQACGDGRHFS